MFAWRAKDVEYDASAWGRNLTPIFSLFVALLGAAELAHGADEAYAEFAPTPLSVSALSGGVRVISALPSANMLRVGAWAGTFTQPNFPDNRRLNSGSGGLLLNVAMLDHLELGLAIRTDAAKLGYMRFHSTGDSNLSVRLSAGPPTAAVAGALALRIPGSTTDAIGYMWDYVSVAASLAFSSDLRGYDLPVRVHVNGGYRSELGGPGRIEPPDTRRGAQFTSALVWDVWDRDQFFYGLAMEVLAGPATPFLEMSGRYLTSWGADGGVSAPYRGQDSHLTLTPGVLVQLTPNCSAQFAADIALLGRETVEHQPINPPWMARLGILYRFAPTTIVQVETVEIEKILEKVIEKEDDSGRIRMCIVSGRAAVPQADVVVELIDRDSPKMITAADGCVTSGSLPPSTVNVRVGGGMYDERELVMEVVANTTTSSTQQLERKTQDGDLTVEVLDLDGRPLPAAAELTHAGSDSEQKVVEISAGTGSAKLASGKYDVVVRQAGYLVQGGKFEMHEGGQVFMSFVLRPTPAQRMAWQEADHIELRTKVPFDFNAATIRPDGKALLEEISDVILANRRIQKVFIEGHTDNVGRGAINRRISDERALAVLEYLKELGVPQHKLAAIGRGETKPLASNRTARGRAANRRVQFLVVEQPAEEASR